MKILQEAIIEFYEKSSADVYPRCFKNSKEYAAWSIHEEEANTAPRKFVCRDCDNSFQEKMKSVGRCYIPNIRVDRIVC